MPRVNVSVLKYLKRKPVIIYGLGGWWDFTFQIPDDLVVIPFRCEKSRSVTLLYCKKYTRLHVQYTLNLFSVINTCITWNKV